MKRLRWIKLSLTAFFAAAVPINAQQYVAPSNRASLQPPVPLDSAPAVVGNYGSPAATSMLPNLQTGSAPQAQPVTPEKTAAAPAAPAGACTNCGAPSGSCGNSSNSCGCDYDCGSGPTPLGKVGILQNCIFGDCADKAPCKISGWMDFDYTYRSTGHGQNNIAPVMNRFGDEFLVRQLGLYLTKPLSTDCCWSWGYNAIFIAGADASFLGPTFGGWANTDPRFGTQFTDLNVTVHAPILTEGGVDFKIGRQTTCLGPMGALPWQRYFTSSDYAWYNLEEGRYTGISSVWHVNKQLDIYNGIEFGWGEFFDYYSPAPQYLGQISYWLDEKAEKCKVWSTVLTGPTGSQGTGNTTVVEVGFQHNINKCVWDIVDFQCVYSKCPIFGPKPPGYIERAYDVYNYLGFHLNPCWDLNTRAEWYFDVDGGGYAGGFGIPDTHYFEGTIGLDYHPVKWLQIRPEIRYDYATNPAFGASGTEQNQLSIAGEVLIKF